MELERYYNSKAQLLYNKFFLNGADINICEKAIKDPLKKKRPLPLVLETMQEFKKLKYPLLGNKKLSFEWATFNENIFEY